jgi:hypothetical protein
MSRKFESKRSGFGSRSSISGKRIQFEIPMITDWTLRELPGLGTIRAQSTILDEPGDASLGGVHLDAAKRVITVMLNVRHPGVRAAHFAIDAANPDAKDAKEVLVAYVMEAIWMMVGGYHEEHGAYPWDWDEWPEFLYLCEEKGRLIRPVAGRQDLGKIQ